jgi:serine/threonine-protein kinase HipA
MESSRVFVCIQLGSKILPVGTLWYHRKSGRERASFAYDASWLRRSDSFAIDPALNLTEGTFHTFEQQKIFGAIGDSAPDRWGRVLMKRAESARAKTYGETPRSLGEIDYLLGVNDMARQGALRFSLQEHGPYLASADVHSIPPLIHLPQLLDATTRYLEETETMEDLQLLLTPGSSLGGARPKASVVDLDGQLALAKFGKKDDEFSAVLWEAVALTLAEKAGIHTTEWRLITTTATPVLLVRRFDRKGEQRIPFLSAMSMLGASDNEERCYLEIAYALEQYGAKPEKDLEQLWRRIIFTVLISNTDDHLRNHGFLYDQVRGWYLSPAYDMNPVPGSSTSRILSTAITFDDPTASLDAALQVAKEFRLTSERAKQIIGEVYSATSYWDAVARQLGIAKSEIERMASAFSVSVK